MKKLTSLSLMVMLMIFVGLSSVAEARTGKTTSSSSSSSSSSKSRTSSSSSSSSPSRTTTSKTDSAFSKAAKTNEAKSAWQDRNKKVVETAVIAAPVITDNAAKQREEKQRQDQLNRIEKQLAETKRQQQIIAAAQAALQLATQNKRPTPAPVNPTPRVEPVKPPVTTAVTPPVNTAVTTTTTPAPAKSGGTSWIMIFLVVGGIIGVIIWLKSRNASDTIYRL